MGGRGGGAVGERRGGGGNTGTSHELNRTANSSTRVGEEGEGTGRFYVTLRTRTHTKKTGHKLHFQSKLQQSDDSVRRGRGYCGGGATAGEVLASTFLRILHTLLRQACVGRETESKTWAAFGAEDPRGRRGRPVSRSRSGSEKLEVKASSRRS